MTDSAMRTPAEMAVQAHLAKAAKFSGPDAGTRPARDWSLFHFFRIQNKPEIDTALSILTETANRLDPGSDNTNLTEAEAIANVALFLANPGAVTAGIQVDSGVEWPEDGAPNGKKGKKKGPVFLRLSNADPKEAPDNDESITFGMHPFINWLSLITNHRREDLVPPPRQLHSSILAVAQNLSLPIDHATTEIESISEFFSEFEKYSLVMARVVRGEKVDCTEVDSAAENIKRLQATLLSNIVDTNGIDYLIGLYGKDALQRGQAAVKSGLPAICLFEILRHFTSTRTVAPGGVLASLPESEKCRQPRKDEQNKDEESPRPIFDRTPITLAFTHRGLSQLRIEQDTLDSFPEVFKDGMARRAGLLGDTGANAPGNWEGELGLDSVHGYFDGGFHVGNAGIPDPCPDAANAAHDPSGVTEQHWKRVRRQVRAFNERRGDEGWYLRMIVGAIHQLFGMEIVHFELGQYPYKVGPQDEVIPTDHRLEHFGFRDGISQPFVNLGLGDAPAGGGTPKRNGGWDPIAAGEIFLGSADEDGNEVPTPLNDDLRVGGTYLVFRKLEQDVPGFHTFLAQQREGALDRDRLAAQIVGRWKNGVSLIHSPHVETSMSGDDESQLNNFRYAGDDPHGRKCPLGAHARRTNPRDIGGQENVRRHRILRRGISYGGSLLDPGSAGDGEARGLLFIAANARIDLQFEVIQGNWINRGEFLGQVGLGRCPLTGGNDGDVQDAFLEAGAAAPVSRLPRFVSLKGGDYFFAPSINAIRGIVDHYAESKPADKLFPAQLDEAPYDGHSMADPESFDLFDENRLDDLIEKFVCKGEKPKSYDMLPSHGAPQFPDPAGKPVTFVGKHADVVEVLSGKTIPVRSGKITTEVVQFSMAQQITSARRLTRGADLLFATDLGSPTEKSRRRMQAILQHVWLKFLSGNFAMGGFEKQLRYQARTSLMAGLRRAKSSGTIDLVQDLASRAAYDISDQLFGVPGPDWLTELAVALPFSRSHFGQLDSDWLRTLTGNAPENRGLATMQIWSILINAGLTGDIKMNKEIAAISLQATSELLTHLDLLLAKAIYDGPQKHPTLLDTFVGEAGSVIMLVRTPVQGNGDANVFYDATYSPEDYQSDVRALLLEVATSAVAAIPLTFGTVMSAVLDFRLDLTQLVPLLEESPKYYEAGDGQDITTPGLYRLIYETARLKPSIRLLVRHCEVEAELSKVKVPAGNWVVALLPAANLDGAVFHRPKNFSLGPFLPHSGPILRRNPEDYLLFGARGKERECWGNEANIAPLVIAEAIRAASRLPGLSRVAGEAGEPKKFAGATTGLPVKFARLGNTVIDLDPTQKGQTLSKADCALTQTA